MSTVWEATTHGTNEVYRLRGGIWTALSSMTTARYRFAAVLYDNTVFVFGGVGTMSSVEAFDIAAQSWTNKATPPSGAQQYGQAAVLYRDLIWQCGGVPRYECLLHVQPAD